MVWGFLQRTFFQVGHHPIQNVPQKAHKQGTKTEAHKQGTKTIR